MGALAKRSSEPIADLMTCSKAAKETLNRPTMGSDAYVELNRDGIGYYTDKVFGGAADMESVANDAEDQSDKANFARYLRRTTNRMAMPDFCYKICKSVVDALTADLDKAADTCKSGSLQAALDCMETSGNSKCSSSEFYQNHYGECNDGTSLSRRLEEDEDTETLVPVVDGVADLSKTAPQFQAAISSARISFNATSEERRLDTRRWKSCSSFKLSRRRMNWLVHENGIQVPWLGLLVENQLGNHQESNGTFFRVHSLHATGEIVEYSTAAHRQVLYQWHTSHLGCLRVPRNLDLLLWKSYMEAGGWHACLACLHLCAYHNRN